MMRGLFKGILILSGLSLGMLSYAQTNACSGTYTTVTSTCQAFTIGDGTPGFIEVCFDVDNIPTGGGVKCGPGGACDPPYGGGGWDPRISIYTSGGTFVGQFFAGTATGTCITVPSNDGYAQIYSICMTAGSQISWTTKDCCGQDLCSGPVAACVEPGCCDCDNPCGDACGFTTPPAVADVTSGCPDFAYSTPLGPTATSSSCYNFSANNTTVDFGVIVSSNCVGGNVTNFSWELYEQGSCGGPVLTGTLASLTMNPLVVGQIYTFCYTFTTPNCTHTTHYPYFVGASPLTVELMDFSAQSSQETIEVIWNVQSEFDNEEYILERSMDGEYFTEIGRTKGAGKSGEPLKYTAVDNRPMHGVNYYRLTSVDVLGNHYPLGIASAKHVSNEAFEANKIFVYDLGGNLIKTIELGDEVNGYDVVNQIDLENGAYLIQMFNKVGESRSFKKMIINEY